MGKLLSLALSGATSALGGVWGYVAVAVFSAGLAATGAVITANKFADAKYEKLQLKDAKAVTASLVAQAAALNKIADTQHALDTEVTAGAVSEARAQGVLDARLNPIIKEVTHYVTLKQDAVGCVTYGFVRVLDATILAGTAAAAPSDLALPAGQSDDACTPVKASDLAASIAANYGTAAKNAEQLNALEAEITRIITQANK